MPEKKERLSDVNIRPYTKEDYLSVREVLEDVGLFYEPMDNEALLAEQIDSDPNSMFVSEVDDRVVGSMILKAAGWGPLLFRLAVAKEFQKQGIGTGLMAVAERELEKRGRPEIHILVDEDDKELQGYYERLGYQKGSRYQWMWKDLNPRIE